MNHDDSSLRVCFSPNASHFGATSPQQTTVSAACGAFPPLRGSTVSQAVDSASGPWGSWATSFCLERERQL